MSDKGALEQPLHRFSRVTGSLLGPARSTRKRRHLTAIKGTHSVSLFDNDTEMTATVLRSFLEAIELAPTDRRSCRCRVVLGRQADDSTG